MVGKNVHWQKDAVKMVVEKVVEVVFYRSIYALILSDWVSVKNPSGITKASRKAGFFMHKHQHKRPQNSILCAKSAYQGLTSGSDFYHPSISCGSSSWTSCNTRFHKLNQVKASF